jgi:hypothetical protein
MLLLLLLLLLAVGSCWCCLVGRPERCKAGKALPFESIEALSEGSIQGEQGVTVQEEADSSNHFVLISQ